MNLTMQVDGAHEGAIWSMDLQPDKHGFATGGADRSVNIWEFELVPDEANEGLSKRLSCAHLKALKMTDDVLCVKFSPDQRFLAVALLDSTVKVRDLHRRPEALQNCG
jgi:U3 small nucleolar RNA-associated protein 12